MKISAVIQQEKQSYKESSVRRTSGDYFNQFNTLERINKYKNSKFLECDDQDAIFWNLSTPRIPLFAKSIDWDTKDFKIKGIGKFKYLQSWILNVRFRKWVKDTRFALVLDDLATKTATYGSSVWKKEKFKGKYRIKNVNLLNLVFDPTVENIIQSPVIEFHYLTETQIRKKFPDFAQRIIDNAKEARDIDDNKSETTVEQYEIWERWGDYENEEEGQKMKYMHFIGSGYGDGEVIILEEEVKTDSEGQPIDFPYYDFHIDQYTGTWLREGVVERLFILQERANTIVNQNAEITHIASLLLFRTQDSGTNGNLLKSALNGQIVASSDLQQITIQNNAIGALLKELELIERQADSICFITETVSGETPPSGVPFRSLAVASNASRNTFKFIATSMGEKIALILQEQILPEEIKDWKKEDLIDIEEDEQDMRLYDKILIKQEVDKFKKAKIKANVAIAEEDIADVVQRATKAVQENRRSIKVTDDIFDFKWGVDMNPTGEGADKNALNAAIDGALQDLLANPNVVNVPLYQTKLEVNGIPPFRLTQEEVQQLQGSKVKEVSPQVPEEDKLSAMALA